MYDVLDLAMTQPSMILNLPKEALPRLRRALLDWHRRNPSMEGQAPWRTSGDPYLVLVAAVMAQQTQMSRVDRHGRVRLP